jgi:hypothetical protein
VVKFGKDPIYRTSYVESTLLSEIIFIVDSPMEGEEPYLFWGHYHYTVSFDNLYRRAYFVMHTFLV